MEVGKELLIMGFEKNYKKLLIMGFELIFS